MATLKPKVLQICAVDLSVEHLLKPLILRQIADGQIVHIACAKGEMFENLVKEGFEMIEVPFVRAINLKDNYVSVLSLYKLMKKENYDIVHVHTPVAALLGRIAAKLAGVKKIVYTAHGFYFNEDMKKQQYLFYYWVEKIAARFFTDWLLIQSKEDYQLAINHKFMKKNQIIHLSNGVDVHEKFNPDHFSVNDGFKYREKLAIEQDAIVFLFVGRLVTEKGIHELLESFRKLRAENEKVVLLVVGANSKSEREHINAFQEEEKIYFLGTRNDINYLIHMSDVFVLPSYREGLPRSIIEAMSMGKPIIASNIRGCREEVFQGVNGILVEPKDTVQLKNALSTMCSNGELRTEFGGKSREIAVKHFNETKILHLQIELFNNFNVRSS